MANVSYTRINWQDAPNTSTPINASNLNKMDKGIYDCKEKINQINTDLTEPIVDIVANGTKTYQQLLTEVYTAYQSSGKTLSDRATLRVRNNVAQLSSGQKLSFVFSDISANYINFSEYSLVDKTYLDGTVNANGTITINDGTTGTLASGSHILLYI